MTASSTRRVPVEDIGDVEVTVSDRGDGHPVVPRSAESQVFVTQGTGITLFLTIARSHDSVKATPAAGRHPSLLRRGRRRHWGQCRAP